MSPATGGDLQQPTSVVHTELFSQPSSTTHVLSPSLFFWFVFIDLPGGQKCENLPGIHFRCSHLFLPARPCLLKYRSTITPPQTPLCWSKHTNYCEKIKHKRLSKWTYLELFRGHPKVMITQEEETGSGSHYSQHHSRPDGINQGRHCTAKCRGHLRLEGTINFVKIPISLWLISRDGSYFSHRLV